MKMNREEQEMLREVFKLKLDKIDNALYVLRENTDLGAEFQKTYETTFTR
jgi:hypothetical protein